MTPDTDTERPDEETETDPELDLFPMIAGGTRSVGASPGIDQRADLDVRPAPGAIGIQCLDYGPGVVDLREHESVDDVLARERTPGATVRWINVEGLNAFVVSRIRAAYGIHTLAAEDVLHVHQRSKLDPYEGHLFIVLRMLQLKERLVSEQVSLFLFPDAVITFQETEGDVWDPVRERIHKEGSRLRNGTACYLVYALLDALIDNVFPILERYGERLEDLELEVAEDPSPELLHRVHSIKRELLALRKVIWPTRQVADDLYNGEFPIIAGTTRAYLRDVHDHAIQVIDIVETYREMAAGLTDTYMTAISNRTNEVMKVLTIMASVFIPVTFLAGVYGMNFQHIPELSWRYSYAVFWALCLATAGALLYFFRRKGWLG